MSAIRWTLGLPLAAGVTAALFLLMAAMIRQDLRTEPPKNAGPITIIAKIIERPPETGREAKSVPQETPPQPETRWREGGGEKPAGTFAKPTPGPIGEAGPDLKGVRPIMKFPPAYPEACKSRGAEGAVLVQFDITDRGEVTNVRVISSDNRCFDRAVVRAVLGWKYPPSARRGVTERIVFKLDG